MAVGDKATALANASAQLYQQRQAAVKKLDCNLAGRLCQLAMQGSEFAN